MKPLVWLGMVAVVVLSSCSKSLSTKQYYDDDVYFSSKDLRNYTPPPVSYPTDSGSYNTPSNNNSAARQYTPDYANGQQVIDDYYDYSYAARIRRFYYPSYGMGYYDPWYTNTYWYDYNPYTFGTSVYVTYNFWPNSYNYWGYGNPWGYSPWGYRPWGYGNPWCYGWGSPWTPYPTYGWGYGGFYNPWNNPWNNPWGWNNGWAYNNGYWNGYYDGYNNGYYNGYNNGYYFNGYDNNSYSYYGPYKQSSTSGNKYSFGEKMQTALATDGGSLKFAQPGKLDNVKADVGAPATQLGVAPGAGGNTITPQVNAITKAPAMQNVGVVNNGAGQLKTNQPVINKPATVPAQQDAKPGVAQPAQTKPSITGKPIQIFEAPGDKGNVNAPANNRPDVIAKPNNERPQQNIEQPRSFERPDNVAPQNNQPKWGEPGTIDRPSNDRPQQYQAPQRIEQPTNDRPQNIEQPRNIERPQQNNNWEQPRSNERPQPNNSWEQPRNNDKPSYEQPRNNSQPSYEKPRNYDKPRSNSSWESPKYDSKPRNNDSWSSPKQNSSPSYSKPSGGGSWGGGGNTGGGSRGSMGGGGAKQGPSKNPR